MALVQYPWIIAQGKVALVLSTAPAIYETTPENERQLRDYVFNIAFKHWSHSIKPSLVLRELALQSPDLIFKIATKIED
ncbi:hypothetical protein ABVK25_007629 [Lepraria finkii]|uniref:Uncharacterized protein n=1 Tax=Lepraria finkii TaxID=1340010 RepID=A0ABR4B4E4_9LECA